MANIRLNSSGAVILKDGKVSCECCCPTALPAWQYESAGAMKTKCGAIKAGEPNERYRKLTQCSGNQKEVHEYDEDCVYTYTIGCDGGCGPYYEDGEGGKWRKYTKTTRCVYDVEPVYGEFTQIEEFAYVAASAPGCYTSTYRVVSAESYWEQPTASCFSVYDPLTDTWSGTYSNSSGSESIDYQCSTGGGYTCDPDFFDYSEPVTLIEPTYELPYTTSELIANTQAAIDPFDSDWDDTAGSYRNLPATELSYSERRAKARLPLAGLGMENGRTYNAIYVIRFTPLDGGAATDGPEETLSVAFATGMTHSAPINIAVPIINGTNTAVLLRWECPS